MTFNISKNPKKVNSRGMEMLNLAKKLFPLNRSLMGPDYRSSLKIFSKLHKEFKNIIFKTGESVFDWQIPKEWWIRDAYIEHESGQRFSEFKKNNLHLVGYSIPINKIITKNELLQHLHFLPEDPDAIPYVTSYYQKYWGFCLPYKSLKELPEGNYKVFIDSQLKSGEMNLIEAVIPGESKKEIFFSSYLCHPSMANNELSGPVLLNEVLDYVKNLKNRKYTYRFVLGPETLGAIAYLSRNLETLKRNMECGFNLSCVGDERSYSHVKSRFGNNLADYALSSALVGLENVREYSFLERGSDERQYCSPGIDLPVCTFCRTKFGCYPEYHTSKDDFNLVTEKGLNDSFVVMKNIINAFELGLYPFTTVLCEANLGRRNLYPNLSKNYKKSYKGKLRLDIMTYSDSKTSIFEISKKINEKLEVVIDELKILKNEGLITFNK